MDIQSNISLINSKKLELNTLYKVLVSTICDEIIRLYDINDFTTYCTYLTNVNKILRESFDVRSVLENSYITHLSSHVDRMILASQNHQKFTKDSKNVIGRMRKWYTSIKA